MGVAADQVGGRGLARAAAPFVERIEGNHRHERLAAGKLIFLNRGARRDHLAAEADAFHRRNEGEPLANAIGIGEERSKVLLLGGAGIEHAGFGEHRARRCGAGVEQFKLELDRDLIVVDLTAQRLKG